MRSAQCKEKSITKPELGHLKKADASAHRHLAEFRDEAGELLVGQTVTVEAFAVGDNIKVSGKTKGKGFQGTIKRHNFSSGPEVARVAQRPRAGLDRRVGDAVAGVQGHARPRPDGRRARHPARADRGRGHPEPEPDARPRRRSRARAAGPWRCGPMARTASVLGGGSFDARSGRVRGVVQHAARARDRARRAERAPARHRVDQDARRGLGRRCQALAPEGHRPGPRRIVAFADMDRRWHGVRPEPRATTP